MSSRSLIRRTWLEGAMAVAIVLGAVLGAQFFVSSFEKSKAKTLAENARMRGDAEALRAARERTSRKHWAYLVTGADRELAAAHEAERQFLALLQRQAEGEVEMAATFERLGDLEGAHRELTARMARLPRDPATVLSLQSELQPIIEELDSLLAQVVQTRRARVEGARAELISASQTGIVVFAVAAFAGLLAAGVLGFSLVRHLRAELSLRDQAARTERLAALGTLSAGVAHEIKNPLTYIAANLRFIEQATAKGVPSAEELPELREALSDARNGTARLQAIIDDMWRFSRGEAPVDGGADVRDAVEWAVRVSRKQIEQKARLRVQLDAAPPVRGDGTRIGQVVLNLLLNAADAIPPDSVDTNEIAVTTKAGTDGVDIVIRDTGAGMDRALLERLFEPFFTTKGPGKGTGLGLAISRTYVQRVGGSLEVTSAVGAGTTFRIRLPVMGQGAPALRDVVAQ